MDPGNIGKRSILIAWELGNTGKQSILITWEFGNTEIVTLGYFYKKRRAPKSDEDWSDFRADISYETDSGPKTETDKNSHMGSIVIFCYSSASAIFCYRQNLLI